MRFTKRKKTWMAWLVAISMMLSASPAVFAEQAVPSGGRVTISSVQYSKGKFTARFFGMKNAQQARRVQFKVWSTANQSDAKWYDVARQSDDSYSRTISIAKHNYAGVYQVEVHVTDTQEKVSCQAKTSCDMSASAGIKVKYRGGGVYRATVSSVRYPGGYKKIKYSAWSNKNGRDDVRWYRPAKINKKKGKYYFDIKMKKHKHLGGFTGNLYVYDTKGVRHYICAKTFKMAEPKGTKVKISKVNLSKGTFTARMTGIKNRARLKKVRFKVWSTATNAKWYTAKKQKDGTYKANIKIKKHGYDRGIYNVYGYTVDIKKDYKYQTNAVRSMALPAAKNAKKTPVIYARTAAATNRYARKLGIDVSHWNGTINWAKVKEDGVQFAIIRTSDSTGTYDRQWVNNVRGCVANKIPFGVYIYSRAKSKSKAAKEANLVLSRLKEVNAKPVYPIYYDLEDQKDIAPLSNSRLAKYTKEFARVIQNAGYTAGVYSSLSWWNTKLTNAVFNNYPRWVAQWPIRYTVNSKCGYTKGTYKMWQFSDNGRVSGISGAVDLNWMY